MIGKTILNMSTAVKNWKNKDQGPWSLVVSTLVFAIALHSPYSSSQESTSTKSKAAVKGTVVAEEVDDNVADTDDESDESSKTNQAAEAADDNPEEPAETLEAGDNPQAPAVVEEQTVEDSTEPVAEQAPAELMLEAPPAESLQTEAPIETVPVEPAPVVAEPTPEPYVAPPVTETVPVEKVTEADMVEVIPREKNVEIEPRKRYTNYRDRRTTHGFLFSFNAENLYFQDYASLVDQKLYEELFGQEDLTLLQVQVDYKLNFMLGSIIAGAGFGQGTLIDDRVGEERGLTISKKSLRAQWLLDSITKEPYFVPYLGASLWQFGISEENKTLNTTNSYDTGNGTALTVGFLIQLNWLEPEVAKGAYLAQGLENTYLDVFWTQYQNTDDELDPVFENDFNFGVGLRMEF